MIKPTIVSDDGQRLFRIATTKWLTFMVSHSPIMLWIFFWIALTGIGCIIVGLCHDLRIAIIGWMIIFLILPMAVAMLFFIYGLKQINAINSSLHTISISSDGSLVIKIYSRNNQKQTDTRTDISPATTEEIKTDMDVPEFIECRELIIAKEAISQEFHIDNGGNWQAIKRENGKEWLFIPNGTKCQCDCNMNDQN